jgi:proton-translocating NADH-quinone oxidoreductase chain N
MNAPIFIWLIAVPLIASPLVYLIGQLGNRLGRGNVSHWIGFLFFLASWTPFVLTARQFAASGPMEFTYGVVSLRLDGLGLLLAAVALGLGTLVALYSGPYMSKEAGQEKFYSMLIAMVAVMIGLGCASDLFNLWIWFEAMAVSSYLLVAFYRDLPASLEAGVKYLIQSASGSVLVLIGIGLVLSTTGTANLAEIRNGAISSPALIAAGALFVIGFGVKAALVPMHTWLPDAHSQAPSGISAMLSGVVIEAGLVAMLRSLLALAAITPIWGPILMGFGALNMLVGNLIALRQKQVKRLLAYSSLAHVGYMLVGLGITFYVGDSGGAQGGLFHLFNHGLMKGLAFLAAGSLLYTLHIAVGDHAPLLVEDLSGAARRYPILAITFSIALLGLGGIPPLAGFMSKWQIFVAGFKTNNLLIEILVGFAAFNSVLSLAYYAPLVNAIYRLAPSQAVERGKSMPMIMNIPLVIMALGILIIGFWPDLMTWLTAPAGLVLSAIIGR